MTNDNNEVQEESGQRVEPRVQPVVMPDPLRMNAYYYGFDETGQREIDEVLSSVAIAGKGCHHTSDWTECHPFNNDLTYVDLIQDRANHAAQSIDDMRRSLLALVAGNSSWALDVSADDEALIRKMILQAEGA